MTTNIRRGVSDRAQTVGNELGALGWLLRTAVLAAIAGAVYSELRKPAAERTWHGKLLGVVPYDFRIPRLDDLRRAYWNPNSPKLFTDRPLGVGWAVNIPTALRRIGITGVGRRRRSTTKASG
ncbi:MAG TPA: hypothetical protein VFM19_06570 [Candidatus Limnocylindria bacterium]|nr:hypothetical protein [Candidatus Limnocylindria bacterium]